VYKWMQAAELSHIATFIGAVAITLVIVIPLSTVVYLLWENPANNYGRDLPLNFHPTAIRASAVLTTPIGVLVATGGNAKLSYCAALEPVAAMDPA